MRGRLSAIKGGLGLALAALLLLGLAGLGVAGSKAKKMAAQEQKAAYALYQKRCLSCHLSVADPERSGKTRDEWTLVVRYMNKHYVQLTDEEAAKIIDLLYAIRPGLEKEAG